MSRRKRTAAYPSAESLRKELYMVRAAKHNRREANGRKIAETGSRSQLSANSLLVRSSIDSTISARNLKANVRICIPTGSCERTFFTRAVGIHPMKGRRTQSRILKISANVFLKRNTDNHGLSMSNGVFME